MSPHMNEASGLTQTDATRCLSDIFGVDPAGLTTGDILVGDLGETEIAAQFSINGETLVAAIIALFGESPGLKTSIRTVYKCIIEFARKGGFSYVEIQAVAVINKKLESYLIKKGFQKTLVSVEGRMEEGYTKKFTLEWIN